MKKLIILFIGMMIFALAFAEIIQQEFLNPQKVRKEYKHKEFQQILFSDDEVFKNDPTSLDKEFIETSGFRIQLISTQNLSEAISVKAEVDSIYTIPVYVDFEPPNYKVRIGNFLSSEEASVIQQRMLKRGFKYAWVVPSKIIIARSK